MKILLAEDDYATRQFMTSFLSRYGEWEPYDLCCLDIMMPVMDGYQTLMGIRDVEKDLGIPEEKAVKIIMTTALNDERNVKMAFDLGCSVYSGKPIDQERFEEALKKLGLI
jgi:two-component system chemotaxis response regulator CheY